MLDAANHQEKKTQRKWIPWLFDTSLSHWRDWNSVDIVMCYIDSGWQRREEPLGDPSHRLVEQFAKQSARSLGISFSNLVILNEFNDSSPNAHHWPTEVAIVENKR